MNVIQINEVSSTGSTGQIVTQLSEVMSEQGIDNSIISSGYRERMGKDNVFFCSSYAGVRLHQLLGSFFGTSGFHSYFATERAISFIKRTKPDLVHLHNIFSFFLNVEMLLNYLKRNDIPTLWTLHDFWAITGHCTHFEASKCKAWQSECDRCCQLKSFPYSRFFDRSKYLFNKKKDLYSGWDGLHLAAVSKWEADHIPYSILKDKEVRVIPNGIDTDVFKQKNVEKIGALKGKFVILSVAMSWSKNKGLDDLKNLSHILKDDEVIVLIGLDENEAVDLPENIIGIAHTKDACELSDYYNMADVYVSASIEETMGLTVVEAMACGTPAVVYNKTALPESVANGCGYVSEKDVEKLYGYISVVRKNGKAKYSEKCKAHAHSNYNKKEQYLKYCDYYKDILNEQV